jgi:hypothetical protein
MPVSSAQGSRFSEASRKIRRLGNALVGKLMQQTIRKKVPIAVRAGLRMSEVPTVEDNAKVNPYIAHQFDVYDTIKWGSAICGLLEGE